VDLTSNGHGHQDMPPQWLFNCIQVTSFINYIVHLLEVSCLIRLLSFESAKLFNILVGTENLLNYIELIAHIMLVMLGAMASRNRHITLIVV
jgi:hypothetical protein